MAKYHNTRDSLGRFTKQTAPKACQIVPGRLYEFRGTLVRAGRIAPNGLRHVSAHKQLHGFVSDSELSFISQEKVNEYLSASKA